MAPSAFEYKNRIFIGQQVVMTLLIAPGETLVKAGEMMTEGSGGLSNTVLKKWVDFSNKMRAVLKGGGTVLSIEPIGGEIQTVKLGEPGVWSWNVKGLEPGTVQLKVDLSKVMPDSEAKTVLTEPYDVEVIVPDPPFPENVFQIVIRWFNGLTQVVNSINGLMSAILILIPAFVLFAGYFGFRRAKSRTSDKAGKPD